MSDTGTRSAIGSIEHPPELPHTRPDQYGEVVPAASFWQWRDYALRLKEKLEAPVSHVGDITLDEIARTEAWLLRFVKPQDRDVVARLCKAATAGVVKVECVPSSIAFTKEDAAKIVERKARALTEEYCHGDSGPGGYTWTDKEAEWQVILLEELAEEFRNGA